MQSVSPAGSRDQLTPAAELGNPPSGSPDARAAAPIPESPPNIPGYRLLRVLGRGGQAIVWLAESERDAARVALKIMSAPHHAGTRARARFEQSIITLGNLDHPGIVRNIECGELSNGQLWHAAEYVEGRMLLEYIDHLDVQYRHERGRESRLPVAAIIELFALICEAVEAAHRVGVIHRDLKPSNIIIDGQGRPHLLDFGHATAPEGAETANITLSGEFLGTPAYASPEQVLCRPGTIDIRTDVYAIGVMLYQCLTGTFPYNVSASLADTFEQIQYADPTPPRVHVPWIDRDLQAIILRALAKPREERYQSVSDIRADLQRYLRGEAVTARGSGTAYLLLKFLRKHRVLTATFCVGGLLTMLYAASMTAMYRRAADAESAALRHAAEAQEKFSIARETLDFVVSQIEMRLDRVAGTRELRQALLKDAYDKLADLTTSNSNDPTLRAELAAVHKKLGSIAKDLHLDDEAARHWKTSLRLLEELLRDQPGNVEHLEALSIAHVLVGDVAKGAQRWPEVRERYTRALAIDEQLAAAHPENDRYLDNLAWSCERMAGKSWCADPAARREFHRRRHEIALELIARDPDNTVRMDNLATSHLFQAALIGDSDRAAFLEHAGRAAALAERMVAAEPLNAKFAFTYVSVLFLQLDEPLRVGDIETARPIIQRIITVSDEMRRRDPEGMWGKILNDRINDARELLKKLDATPDPMGRDLRGLLPTHVHHNL